MAELDEIREMTANVVSSYQDRISAVEEIIERSLTMLDQSRLAKQIVHNELKETLANGESLRKKDFDDLMAPLLNYQEKREHEIKSLLGDFLKSQRELAGQLKRVIQAGILDKTAELEKTIQAAIETVKKQVISFQQEQDRIAKHMQYLFDKKAELTLREFKKILEDLYKEVNIYGIRRRDDEPGRKFCPVV